MYCNSTKCVLREKNCLQCGDCVPCDEVLQHLIRKTYPNSFKSFSFFYFAFFPQIDTNLSIVKTKVFAELENWDI